MSMDPKVVQDDLTSIISLACSLANKSFQAMDATSATGYLVAAEQARVLLNGVVGDDKRIEEQVELRIEKAVKEAVDAALAKQGP